MTDSTHQTPPLGTEDLDRGGAALDDVQRTAPRGARAIFILAVMVATAVVAGVLWRSWSSSTDKEATDSAALESEQSGISNLLKTPAVPRPAPPPPAVAAPAAPPPPPPVHVTPVAPPAPMIDKVALRRLASPLQGEGQAQTPNAAGSTTGPTGPRVDAGPLADKLRPLELAPSVAGQLGNMNMLLTQGTMIDCTLQTKLISTQAGLLTCLATHDVMSANGKVKLIDAGTKFTGYQSGGIVQGQARAFVTWNRLETPTGVILNLGSPGTGPLGEAGLGGFVDNHFWDRFGNAILLSLVGDLGNWAANQGQSGSNNIRFDGTREGGQEVISKILEKSLDIPPTLYKNQGERIGIMVARDLDFSQVYDLKPVY
ncbi:type IV secretion system protein VirB10 [Castellaniella denitrificans]|jgi:type IV secretion system protein VirB10|uniref:Type IV secretion system protein VirB10 n=1 Tax=Castellaniella denitrificans TaxID=56119 RepID=A0ABT4LZK6_9BURK|nr:type IV secretion system protein VirB10 [Castellaniella denitrificans]MCZ4328494.1 type IV secretion system protein VirB10 [Castellaniella denitrificans]